MLFSWRFVSGRGKVRPKCPRIIAANLHKNTTTLRRRSVRSGPGRATESRTRVFRDGQSRQAMKRHVRGQRGMLNGCPVDAELGAPTATQKETVEELPSHGRRSATTGHS